MAFFMGGMGGLGPTTQQAKKGYIYIYICTYLYVYKYIYTHIYIDIHLYMYGGSVVHRAVHLGRMGGIPFFMSGMGGLALQSNGCRANVAHIRQPRPDSGLVCQAKVLNAFRVVPSSRGSGWMGGGVQPHLPSTSRRRANHWTHPITRGSRAPPWS